MFKNHKLTNQQDVQFARLQAWVMSLVCSLLVLFAAAAATRIPHYLTVGDYGRLLSVILFSVLTIVGLVANIHTHITLKESNK
ncbi:hypothetical protein [Candidatus Leptofilum sp.]|uniref:hypothetical protein n=1 Tax=Candidatus Leptofilum sp. TaxID=3241576 RepID=UPI003B5BADCD